MIAMWRLTAIVLTIVGWGLLPLAAPGLSEQGYGGEPPSPACGAVQVKSKGVVFHDANANGIRDAGEPGCPGVVVSDGFDAVKTGADGHYEIGTTDRAANRFLFVVVPSGYRDVGGWYRALPGDRAEFATDFALAPATETAGPNFSFVHVSDLHFEGDRDSEPLLRALQSMKPFEPAMVIATGDQCARTGERALFAAYRATLDKSPIPVRNVVGNHDLCRQIESVDKTSKQAAQKVDSAANFQEFFGPAHYAFDYGGRHFVVLLAARWDKAGKPIHLPSQDKWLRRDLELQPLEKEVLVFQHVPPDQSLLDLLAGRKGAIFTGHWHSSKVLPDCDGAPFIYVNTPPLLVGGIDTSPCGFRLVRFHDGKLSLDYRFAGLARHCAIAAPGEGAILTPGLIEVRVAAYDCGSPRTEVECRIDVGTWQPLEAAGKLTWQVQARCVAPGEHTLAVRARFGNGPPTEKSVRFKVVTAPLPELALGSDWHMFRRDAAHTGQTADEVRPPLRLAWSRPLGGTTHSASPVVANGMVYVGVADDDLAGHAGVYAMDARTGAVRWRCATACSVKNSVAVEGKRVFAGTVDGQIFSLDADTGAEQWRYSLGSALDRWFFSAPVPYKGVVYVGSGPVFVALDAASGKEVWRATGIGTDWISTLSIPAVTDAGVYGFCNWCSTGLYGLRRDSGKPMWAANLVGYGSSYVSPVVVDNTLYFSAYGSKRPPPLMAVDPATGKILWGTEVPSVFCTPLICGSRLVLGENCLNLADRHELWKYPSLGRGLLGFAPYVRNSRTRCSPTMSGAILYVGGNDGRFCAVDSADGTLLWSYDLGLPISSSPAISGNTVFINTYDGMVCAFTSMAPR